jgi:TPR repeat protein
MKTMKHLLAILALMTVSDARGGDLEDLIAKAGEGDATAQYEVGQKILTGDGVPKNTEEAIKWLQKSAALGNADAQMSLGSLYVRGKEIPKNSTEAAMWFLLAAEQGKAPAQIQMARMHIAGAGVVKDNVEAWKWAQLAQDQGDPQANQILVFLRTQMTAAQMAAAREFVQEFKTRQAADAAAKGIPMVAPPLDEDLSEAP